MKTATDYRKIFNNLDKEKEALKNRVGKRLFELATNYPDAIVSRIGDTPIKASTIANSYYISTIELSAQIDCIERIEKYIESISPVKQLEFNFN